MALARCRYRSLGPCRQVKIPSTVWPQLQNPVSCIAVNSPADRLSSSYIGAMVKVPRPQPLPRQFLMVTKEALLSPSGPKPGWRYLTVSASDAAAIVRARSATDPRVCERLTAQITEDRRNLPVERI